jgi:hypothetical protein
LGTRAPAPELPAWHDFTGEMTRVGGDRRPDTQRLGAAPGAGSAPKLSPISVAKAKRAELRRQLRIAQQLKVATLMVVAMLLLAAYPVYLFTRTLASDPVFVDLDNLNLPSWAAGEHSDAASGSRWCIGACRFRERTWQSQRAPDETNGTYQSALRGAGWRPRTVKCPNDVTEGLFSCWKRDEYVMDVWVRAPICDIPPPRPSIVARPGASAGASPAAPPPPPKTCPGALVTMKVFNAIDYHPVG